MSRSQSDRTSSKPEISAGDINFVDTMRLSLCKKSKEVKSSMSPSSTTPNEIKEEESNSTPVTNEIQNPLAASILRKSNEILNEATPTFEKQLSAMNHKGDSNNLIQNSVHFRKMRPTNWSPPPTKSKNINRDRIIKTIDPDQRLNTISSEVKKNIKNIENENSFDNSSAMDSKKIEINQEKNICKINVSPKLSPLVHRLQVGSNIPTGSRRTSILINGEHNASGNDAGNKVTISVGGENSVCNPTVISVNSGNLPKIQNSSENRTLVILENYKSNIVIESNSKEERNKFDSVENYNNDGKIIPKVTNNNHEVFDHEETIKEESKNRLQDLDDTTRWSSLSKESLISKLLEDSLKKARENGEILDESSGEAILKILKQSLLKSKEYESSESTLEADNNYCRSSSLNSENHFMSPNLFMEENPYEVIKEPIYEEIPDEPPPLPMSPPPTEDYLKDRIYFGDEYKENYYKKTNGGQFLGFYLSDEMFKKPTQNELRSDTYFSKSPEDYFKKSSSPPGDENLSTKFELFNFLINSKDHVVPMEEDEDEEEDEEDTERDLDALYEQKETSLGDLSSKSSQISNVSDSSEECNIILTSSPETLKVNIYLCLIINLVSHWFYRSNQETRTDFALDN